MAKIEIAEKSNIIKTLKQFIILLSASGFRPYKNYRNSKFACHYFHIISQFLIS